MRGDIYAQIEQPCAVVGPALRDVDHWCDMLILHLNVKGCRAVSTPAVSTLQLHELERDEYLAMKRHEIRRQQTRK